MDAIGCRFPSVGSLQKAYEACRDTRRRSLLLARLLCHAQGDGETDEARAEPGKLKLPTVQLVRRATLNLATELRAARLPDAEARGGAERAQIQLHGTGEFSDWRSAPCHIHLLEGSLGSNCGIRKIQQLFPAVAAVLILKHKVNTLSWSTRKAALEFLEALCEQFARGEMLQG
eukprot:s7247_g2.t1